MRVWIAVLALLPLLAGSLARGAEDSPPGLFPFVLPWDDASSGVTDLSAWLPKPAGKFGPVHAGTDGHLYTGDRRIRFFGVNLCFAADFPRKEDAEAVAARMAKFGINVVRFHHMDTSPFPDGIRAPGAEGTGELSPQALDRLDYLISRLEAHGIYANLNLLVGRPFNRADGLPADIEEVGWKDRHVVGFFYEPARRLQEEYARKLLGHRNPYTRRTYAEDPAVAFVEINNENGLIHAWLGGQVDRLPEVFRRDLRRQWNAWLVDKYHTTDALRRAWGARQEEPGENVLANADFSHDTEHWVLERHEGAEAALTVTDEAPSSVPGRSARVAVTRAGAAAWHVQLNQAGLRLRGQRPYTLTFWAKADRPLEVTAAVGEAHAPWGLLGLNTEVKLTTAWQRFRFVFEPTASDDNARLNFTNLARQAGTLWLAGVSLRPGGAVGLEPGERLEDDTVGLCRHDRFSERTAEGQRDWLRFLWQTEDAYWQAMQRYLKDDLGVRGVVIGTIVGCSTPNLMARLDAVDSHAYWQHPKFPHREWDPEDWVVPDRSMVNEAGGTLPGLALRRVQGKPHTVTEYNHPAPNTYSSEGFLLLAAYGALQDWDAVYAFDYSGRRDWDARRIPNFFDIDQHPTKMATLPAAVALFARGDVRPAREDVTAGLDREREIELLRRAGPWELVDAGTAGVPRETALVHRVAVVTGSDARTTAERPAGPRYRSDTGELLWDLSAKGRGVVTVDTARSKAVIGYGGGKRFDLGGVVLEPGVTAQDGWAAVTLTAVEGELTRGPARLLLTATGYAQNTGMRWKDSARNSVGRDWGRAPSLVEGIPVTLTLPVPAERVRTWALDGRGQRGAELPATPDGEGRARLRVGPGQRTLWYEIELR